MGDVKFGSAQCPSAIRSVWVGEGRS